jgi:two-component system response regulator RegA
VRTAIAAGSAATRRHGNLMLLDDDPVLAQVLARALGARGFAVCRTESLEACTQQLAQGYVPDFAVLDLNLNGSSGLKAVAPLKRANAECEIVVLTGYASISTAVDAIKLGARQYLSKPVEVDAIVKALLEDVAPDLAAVPEETLSVSRLEWEHIQRVLAENDGNVSATARALKMHRRTLQRKLGKRPARE